MKVTVDKTENRETYLTVEMDPAEVEESMEKTYRKAVLKTRVPGFRPGKAPRTVFERHVGRQALLEDALDDLIPEAYDKAIKDQAIEAIARPRLEVTQTDPVIFKAVVPLKPVVTLGDYKAVRVTPEPAREVTDKDVDAVIDALRHQYATWETIKREARSGDLTTIDIWSTVGEQPYINQKGVQFQPADGSAAPLPGFSEQIIGMKPEEEKEFKLSFPADHANKEFAGKEGQFKVRLNEVKQEVLPEVTDDFAKKVGTEFADVAALRERANTDLKKRRDDDARIDFENKVMQAVVDGAKTEFPEVLIDTEIHRLIEQRFRTRDEVEAYLKATGKTEDQLHEELHTELKDVATERVKRGLILGQVAEEEKLEVAAEEIDAEIKRLLDSSTGNKENLEKALNAEDTRESLRETLLTRKTIERLAAIARGESETVKEKEAGK